MYSSFSGATSQPYTLKQDLDAAAAAGFGGLELWGAKFGRFLDGHTIGDPAAMPREHKLQPAAIDFAALDLSHQAPRPMPSRGSSALAQSRRASAATRSRSWR